MTEKTDLIAQRYKKFAFHEARNISPLYETFATAVSCSADVLHLLADLPEAKQQPNLLFGAMRLAVGLPASGVDVARHVKTHWDAIRPIVLSRSTQTNEPGRCACLLPLLAQCDEPLALIEVGAAAGLCLLPDRYGYDYGHLQLAAPEDGMPVFPCSASVNTPLPEHHPEIVWRAGLDLNPLNVRDKDDMLWLQTLVWPEQAERLARLNAAIGVAQQEPPMVVAGDILTETERLAASAPTGARLIIFHSAVLTYVAPQVRKAFQTLVADIGADWVANEGQRVLPDIQVPASAFSRGAFVLSLNGKAVARTGAHGQFIAWLTG